MMLKNESSVGRQVPAHLCKTALRFELYGLLL